MFSAEATEGVSASSGSTSPSTCALAMRLSWQEKLQEDPTFVEKIAREDLNYAKPGETIFRFVDEDKP